MSQPTIGSQSQKEKITQICFETFNVPALYVANHSVLAMYSSGRTTGILLDSGDGGTYAVPIYEGYCITDAIRKLNLAGRDLTNYLVTLVNNRGYSFTTATQRDFVRDMKQKLCYVALDYEKEQHKAADIQSYTLSDGTVIELSKERYMCPEPLFNPSILGIDGLGIAKLLVDSIKTSGDELVETFYSNVVLNGGSTMFPGLSERLEKELKLTVPLGGKVKTVAPPERLYSTWIGGSILSSLSTFQQLWLSKEEYDESGPSIVHRKCF
eukprot:TRINITY_DN1074_c0_g1_i1.p1 TRINITY_DN1074_c0_g1~~TRINITY_DN1074_c0_g1_i1.p1  ORF type:complete len:275 (+),score=42.17 TRINITY_DN1074_c0_g1_i1:22-825(+)